MEQLEFNFPAPGDAFARSLRKKLYELKENNLMVVEIGLPNNLYSIFYDYAMEQMRVNGVYAYRPRTRGTLQFNGLAVYRSQTIEGEENMCLFYTQMGVYSEEIYF